MQCIFSTHTHRPRPCPMGFVHSETNLLSRSNFTSLGEAAAVNITPNWFRTPELRTPERFSNFLWRSLNLQLVSLAKCAVFVDGSYIVFLSVPALEGDGIRKMSFKVGIKELSWMQISFD